MSIKILPAYQINELIRQIARKQVPSCEAKSLVPASQRGRNKALGNKCGNVAKMDIDGKKLCIRHAQAYALAKLLKDKP